MLFCTSSEPNQNTDRTRLPWILPAGTMLVQSDRLASRSEREVALEKQLRALTTFSATDVIASQHLSGRSSWYQREDYKPQGRAPSKTEPCASSSPEATATSMPYYAERTVSVSLVKGNQLQRGTLPLLPNLCLVRHMQAPHRHRRRIMGLQSTRRHPHRLTPRMMQP